MPRGRLWTLTQLPESVFCRRQQCPVDPAPLQQPRTKHTTLCEALDVEHHKRAVCIVSPIMPALVSDSVP
ncbi:hypothetical protein CUR178_03640 [Leishmania enriettii]|uniref:Uncharacterized protein n=1 Tax=Leishmania enriettii TaxID=5663 RepID=A0A836KIW7_LEIEN|nr:hypothetical protein CUR178_03640 [Leishmania enriettii]